MPARQPAVLIPSAQLSHNPCQWRLATHQWCDLPIHHLRVLFVRFNDHGPGRKAKGNRARGQSGMHPWSHINTQSPRSPSDPLQPPGWCNSWRALIHCLHEQVEHDEGDQEEEREAVRNAEPAAAIRALKQNRYQQELDATPKLQRPQAAKLPSCKARRYLIGEARRIPRDHLKEEVRPVIRGRDAQQDQHGSREGLEVDPVVEGPEQGEVPEGLRGGGEGEDRAAVGGCDPSRGRFQKACG